MFERKSRIFLISIVDGLSLSESIDAFLSVMTIVINVPIELKIKLNWKRVVLYSLKMTAKIEGKMKPIRKHIQAIKVVKSNL